MKALMLIGAFVGATVAARAAESGAEAPSLLPGLDKLTTVSALALFLAFFIPGYIMRRIYGRYVPGEAPDFSKLVNEVFANSAIHYAFFGWLVVASHFNAIVTYLVVFVLPALEGVAYAMIGDNLPRPPGSNPWDPRPLLRYLATAPKSPPTAWDAFFSREAREKNAVGLDVRIHFAGDADSHGEADVAGFFGPRSFASSYPYPNQLYLETGYKLEAGTTRSRPINESAGILVNCESAQYIVFRRKRA